MLGILFFLLKIFSKKNLTKGSQNERINLRHYGPSDWYHLKSDAE